MNLGNVLKKQKGKDDMPQICSKCGTCHMIGTPCAKRKTLKQLAMESRRSTIRFLKMLDKFERKSKKRTLKSNIRYGKKYEMS